MFAGSTKPSQSTPTPTTFNERLNEQLINCLNVQTNVIQNLAQYSQHISLQLFEIKNVVEMLSNRVLALQQQPHFAPNHYAAPYYPNYMSHPPPTSHHAPAPTQMPPNIPPQPTMPVRMPNVSAAVASSHSPFFNPTNTANPPPTIPSATPSFRFGVTGTVPASSTQSTITNSLPTTNTTPTKSIFSVPQQFTAPDLNTKQSSALPVTTAANTAVTNTKPTNNAPFSFGGTSSLGSIFGTANFPSTTPVNSAAKQETNADDDGEGGGEDDSYEPDISFKPIITLSAVEVKTGEEDENVLYCERAKLYRFDATANQMKERGTGEIKILQHKTKNVCRILMRREQVLKICANHQISSQMELKPHQGSANAFLWSATDFADGEAKHETLCVRFKTDEQAKKFAKVFNEAKEMHSKKPGDLPAVGKISLNDDDVISIGEIKPSAEQIDRAKKLQLPSTFYLYENKEPCKGCPGCKEDTPSSTANENKATANTAKAETKSSTPQTPSTAPVTKTPLSSSENIKSLFGNADKTQPQVQKQISTTKDDKTSAEASTPTSNATSQYDNKPSIFENFNGTSTSSVFGSSTPTNNTSSSIFGGAPSLKPANNGFSFPGFGGASSGTPSSGFQFSTPAATNSTADTKPTFSFGSAAASSNANSNSSFSFGSAAAADKPLFGNAPKFSFADLAKQPVTKDDKSTTNGSERVFAGQGTLIFGTSSVNNTTTTNNNDEDDGEGGGEDDSYEPNVSFKPVVTLSAVEVKTGEEDENVLFCERGKLYRFDPENNQMKERGIGEMKILQHKTTKVCRILMRREQVLKLCANHQISSHMELKPHQGSENAYVWSCMDFAEGEARHETLCVKFKSSEVAKRFVKQFNDAKEANANAQQ
ncbi:unnamed protein product [Adineta ricciae]|uniref:RanBD1 domain-containing protein n=1 Tax=Adineta ricciae TaxID=249248 RepID=A0A816C702_ADIRI|nr:unnamed protein product [Adineta ricciae]